jgi:hypothetical protein
MPTAFAIDTARRLVSVCARGVLIRDEAIELGRRIRGHADFDFLFSELLDLTMLETYRLEYQDLALLSDRYDPFSRWSKRAFVAVQGGDAYELRERIGAFENRRVLKSSPVNMRRSSGWIW